MEILFTGLHSFKDENPKLTGNTSIWMFPIYGMAAFIRPVYRKIKHIPALFRGMLYSVGIFSFEYLSGSLLRRHELCPWDYTGAKASVDGLIRLDYAPFWMAAGLLFEKILLLSEHGEKTA